MTLKDISNGPDWVIWVVLVIFVLLTICLLTGHGENLISGYNTASQKEKDKYIEPHENQYCLIATVKHDGNTAVTSIQLLHEQNSLRMVNELAKAVFHADYRVYDRMERNLSKNLYSSPEDLLRDAVWYTNQVKNRDKQKRTEDRKER